MWSFVGNKKQQRWLWYAREPRLKRIITHVFGRRSKKTFRKLLESAEMHDRIIGMFIEREYYLAW